MSYSAPTRTWGDVAAALRRQFGDESGVQVEEGDVLRWINQGQAEIARANKVLKAKGTQTTIANQATYSLAMGKNILQVESIRYDGNRLEPTEFTTIDANLDAYPKTAPGDPALWYRWGTQITLWPTPKAAATLDVFFTALPVLWETFDADRVLEIPDTYFQPLLDFVLSKAHEMDDDGGAQQSSYQQYSDRMAAMNDEERPTQKLSYPKINDVE